MNEYFREMWGGPGHLRIFLQPLVAILLGVRDGLKDARAGAPPYLLDLLQAREQRASRLRALLRTLRFPLLLGVGMSLLFQQLIRRQVHLWTALAFGVAFITLPYCVARALANRLASRRWVRP